MNDHAQGETQRMQALLRYNILDTPVEASFDDLTFLAAHICHTPMAIITLVDEKRQWFKSTVGLEINETPRNIAFCSHAILNDMLYVVEDAAQHPLFHNNPLVTGDPYIRFYAGAPLITPDGFSLGTISVLDRVPRQLDSSQERALYALAKNVVVLLEMKRNLVKLKRSARALAKASQRLTKSKRAIQAAMTAQSVAEANALFRTFFEQGPNFLGIMRLDGVLVEVNRLCLEACGYTRGDTIGKPFWACGWWNRSEHTMALVRQGYEEARQGKTFRCETAYFLADGTQRCTDLIQGPVTDENGNILYIALSGTDITERKRAEEALQASEERFRSLAELSPEGIVVTIDDRIVYVNHSAVAIFGACTVSEIIGQSLLDFFDPEVHDLENEQGTDKPGPQQAYALLHPRAALQWRRLNGTMIYVQVSSGKVTWEGRAAVQILIRDITEQKHAQETLNRMHQRLQMAIEGTGEGIWDWHIPSATFTFSGGLNRMLGRVHDNTKGTLDEWRSAIHPDDWQRVATTFYASIKDKKPVYECEYRLKAKDGSWKWVKARGMIVEHDLDGKPLVMTGTLTDVTARKEAEELAWRHANLDPLTNLANRRLFRELLATALRTIQRRDHQLALLFIDLDGFKQVNDMHGHDAGDLLLKKAAERIKRCVRETDTVARLGGDEFTVVLTDLAESNHVEFVCQKILDRLAEPFELNDRVGYVSASIGVSLYPLDATTADALIRRADQAMYAAKQMGKNQFHYFTQELDEKAHLRLKISNELRHAIRLNQFTLYYQPVLELKDSHVQKVEALLRWKHPILGQVEPADFIAIAEESELIVSIGRWVLTTACAQNVAWQQQGLPKLRVAVNLSARHFAGPTLLRDIESILKKTGMPADLLELELTESMVVQNPVKASGVLQEIRRLGVRIAIDDFGTGYSSLAQLKNFPIDTLKVDRSFIQDVSHNAEDQSMTKAIIAMGKSLGLTVVAEGVETEEQQRFLSENLCDETQGYYFCKPVTSEHITFLLSNQHRLH